MALLVILPLGLVFLFSGLVVNALQALNFVCMWPFSKNIYRRANKILTELLWSELVWLMQWWAGVEIRLYADEETWSHMGKEHALVIANHRSDVDWLVGWILAQGFGCLGSTRAIVKKSTKFLPVMGWSMWFSEYIFLERSWAKDENTLKASFENLRGFPQPFWLALFVEGTRFTEAKLKAAQEFAVTSGYPVPRNVLIPRTKGFVSAVSNLREFLPAIYDLTVAVPKEAPPPTMKKLFNGQSSIVHVYAKRYPTSELPETEEGLAEWCKKRFTFKDDMLERHKMQNTFGEELYKPIPRSTMSLLVMLFWSLLSLYTILSLLRPLLSSWIGITWVTGGLATIFFLMQVLILASQSERSRPAKVVPRSLDSQNVAGQ